MPFKATNDQKYRETLTGLDKLCEEGEAELEGVDCEEESDF